MTLDEIVETNQKDYIKDVTYVYDGLKKMVKIWLKSFMVIVLLMRHVIFISGI